MGFSMNETEMEKVAQLLADGTDPKLIEVLVSSQSNADTMEKATTMFNEGLSYDNVLVYINNPSDKFYETFMRFHNNVIENILFLSEGDYNNKQLDQIEKMINENEMTKEEIRFFANPGFNENIMKNLRKAYKNGLNLETAERIFLDIPKPGYSITYNDTNSTFVNKTTPANIDRSEDAVEITIS